MDILRRVFTTVRGLRERRSVRWAIDLALVGGLVLGISAWQARGRVEGPAPALDLHTLDGSRVTTAELRGRPAVIVFWAPWCGVCGAESQNVSWTSRLLGDRATVVSIAVSYDSRAEVEDYVRENRVDYPVLMGSQELAEAFRVRAFPTVYFLDERGTVKGSAVGYTTTLGLLARALL